MQRCNGTPRNRGIHKQTIDAARCDEILAKFDDGKAAIVRNAIGKGSLYYLAAPLKTEDYQVLLAPLAEKLRLNRPVVGVDQNRQLVTGVEVRSVERENDYLICASNLKPEPADFKLEGKGKINQALDLRNLQEIPGGHVHLKPFQETIIRVEK